jgi:hypothetical protein
MEGGVQAAVEWLYNLRPEVRHLFTAHACLLDVGCGAFDVFYRWSHGGLAHEAVEGLQALGLPRCAALLAEANRFFGPSVPRDHQTRVRLLESGGIYSDSEVDPSWCRIGVREVARQGQDDYRKEWDFNELDCLFWEAMEEDAAPDGFLAIAERYARQLVT